MVSSFLLLLYSLCFRKQSQRTQHISLFSPRPSRFCSPAPSPPTAFSPLAPSSLRFLPSSSCHLDDVLPPVSETRRQRLRRSRSRTLEGERRMGVLERPSQSHARMRRELRLVSPFPFVRSLTLSFRLVFFFCRTRNPSLYPCSFHLSLLSWTIQRRRFDLED